MVRRSDVMYGVVDTAFPIPLLNYLWAHEWHARVSASQTLYIRVDLTKKVVAVTYGVLFKLIPPVLQSGSAMLFLALCICSRFIRMATAGKIIAFFVEILPDGVRVVH